MVQIADIHDAHLARIIHVILNSARRRCGLTQTPLEALASSGLQYKPQIPNIFNEATVRGGVLLWHPPDHVAWCDAMLRAGFVKTAAASKRFLTLSSEEGRRLLTAEAVLNAIEPQKFEL